ncbi:hypothetical protein IFM89_015175 [Coptis chinensis]|uniref:60S ribosomal protein L18a-like protein n=1 Tax=Coptis chinensis TaxID=261450 RepID=A0A835GZF3_9MAGN|nr:hypothetical protein IFM89_015175 [Coptis chinensis]
MSEGEGGGEEKKVYGTFQGQQPPQYHHHHHNQPPSIGFPQPAPPPGVTAATSSPSPYYPYGYQAVPVVEGRPVRERRLCCCGIGSGWLLFVLGFFIAAVPWYIGAVIILCARVDHREKPGYIACTIAAVLATIALILGLTKGADDW